ncbi:MAG: flagellar biosynthesis protein FlhB [Sulfuriflexus sp.]|nr:flagellar biosynthesis protein FlhB [Sulfuriflexus sp.]
MAAESGQEKTEQPTPKRLEDSRKKGQIARSRELNTTAILLAGGGGMIFMGDRIMGGLRDLLVNGLSLERDVLFNPESMLLLFSSGVADALLLLLPLFALLTVVALLVPMAMGGFSFSVDAISFKAEKLDPIKGLGKIFAWRGIVELLKALAKFIIVAAVVVLYLNINTNKLLHLGDLPIEIALVETAYLIFWGFLFTSCALIVVTLIDVPFQLWDHKKQLMMTLQEVKDEYKETDGRPEVKQHIRKMQMEMAERRMMQEVPNADVVITNPTHYAVALKYDQTSMGAPRVVAKGADLIAAEIRKVAAENNVPVAAAPPLTRALFYSTELNDEIPAGLYLAVAQILAYVYQLDKKSRASNDEITLPDVPIPDDLQHD